MSLQVVTLFLLFSLSMAMTPGAGNITLMGISNRYGFSAALPFIAGTGFGVAFVFVGAAIGIASLFERYPDLYLAMKYLGAAYLLYLAWKIASSAPVEGDAGERSPGFRAGALVQVLNPKAWIAALMAFAQFVDMSQDYLTQAVTIIALFGVVALFSNVSWACFGAMLKRLLRSPRQMLMINRCLGATLAVTVVMMIGSPL